MLACSQTVMYRDGVCESEVDQKQENRDPVGIMLIQSLSVLFYYPCGSFLYACNVWVFVCVCLDGSGFINGNGIRIAQAVPNFNHPLVSYSI